LRLLFFLKKGLQQALQALISALMNLSDLREIVQNYGFVSEAGIDALVKDAPNLRVVIRFGYGPRVPCKASEVKAKIQSSIQEYKKEFHVDQYVRDVFIPCDTLDQICASFGWIK
jgi:hypothetical protein